MLSRNAALPVAALLLLPLAACGEPSRAKANNTATRRPQPTIVATVFPSPSPSPTPAATGGATTQPTTPATSAPAAAPNAVDATLDNKFTPASVTVKVGTEVTWTNKGGFHTVTGGESSSPDTSVMNGQLSAAGATYKVTFTKAGTYKYFCSPHASVGMTGEVVVQ